MAREEVEIIVSPRRPGEKSLAARPAEHGAVPDAREKLPTPAEVEAGKEVLSRLIKVREAIRNTQGKAKWLDKRYLDPIVGSIGGIFGMDWLGDIAMLAPALWIVKQGKEAGLPPGKIVRMLANIGFDFAIDVIPFLGSIADFFFKANIRNVKIMEKYAKELEEEYKRQTGRKASI